MNAPTTTAANTALAQEVKVARVRAGLSQQQLADRARINHGSYGRYERGERSMDFDTLTAIAVALETTPAALVVAAVENQPGAFRSVTAKRLPSR